MRRGYAAERVRLLEGGEFCALRVGRHLACATPSDAARAQIDVRKTGLPKKVDLCCEIVSG